MRRFALSILVAAFAHSRFPSRAATTVEFADDSAALTEGQTFGISLVVSPFPPPEQVTYRIRVIGGTATRSDFRPWASPGVIYADASIPPSLPLEAIDDGLHEADETIQLRLEILSGAVPGARTNLTALVHNLGPRLSLLSRSPGNEASGASFVVRREGDLDVPVTVDWIATEKGTAVPGVDFQPTRGDVTLPVGVRETQVRVPWIDNGILNPTRTVSIRLSNPSSGATLSDLAMSTAAVSDNEIPAIQDFRVNQTLPDGGFAFSELPDGGVLGVSSVMVWRPNGPSYPHLLTRYDASGSIAGVGVLPEFVDVDSMLALSDGRVVISGDFESVAGVERPGIARFFQDGRFDPSFNPPPDPRLTAARCRDCDGPRVMLVQTGDRVIVVGSDGSSETCLLRLLPSGQIDPTFASTPHDVLCNAYGVWPHTHGAFLVADERRLWRFTEDGSLDPNFQAPELTDVDADYTHKLSVQADGRILTSVLKDGVHHLVRPKEDGTLDPEFAAIREAQVLSNVLPDGHFLASTGSDVTLRLSDGRPDSAQRAELSRYLFGRAHVFQNGVALSKYGAWLRVTQVPKTAVALVAADKPDGWNQEVYLGLPRSSGWRIQRLGETTRPARVRVRTRDGTARADIDYAPIDEVIEFAALEVSRDVELRGIGTRARRSQTFFVDLVEAEGFEQVAPPVTAVLRGSELAFATPGVEPFVFGANRLVVDSRPQDVFLTIEASDDLETWDPLPTRWRPDSFRLEGFDPDAARHTYRFYRARSY